MNWYKKSDKTNDSEVFGWPNMEVHDKSEPSNGLYDDWRKPGKDKKLQGMANRAQELMNLQWEAIKEEDFEKARMYDELLTDWREQHSERTKIHDGPASFIVNMFEDGSMW